MSGSKIDNGKLDGDAQAFEYVIGTLRGDEREAFSRALHDEPTLRAEVQFWEEQLFPLTESLTPLPPAADSWNKIAARITTPSREAPIASPWWQRFWQWGLPGFLSLTLAVVLLVQMLPTANVPNADYVAILTDGEGQARLTALTTGDSQTMWLQWDDLSLSEGHSAQLWSVSKRDGQIRSVAVLDSLDVKQLPLDEAAWRLVTDAESLLLTEEEPGGSPLDEPSEILLAKGVCVRFNRSNTI